MRIFKIFIVILLFSFSLSINLKADSEKMTLGLDVYNNKAMCGACHILKAAASEGNIGPNLDSLKPTEEQVRLVVTEGLGVMPAFGAEGLLTPEEIDAVSAYVFFRQKIFFWKKLHFFRHTVSTSKVASVGDRYSYIRYFSFKRIY